jgi:hypothetical protein
VTVVPSSVATALLLAAIGASAATGQQVPKPPASKPSTPKPPAPRASSRCFLVVDSIGHQGSQVVSGVDTNLFAGGNVYLRCRGTQITMRSDSLIWDGRQQVVRFIGRVRYRDSTLTMDADYGTYYRTKERWEARGHVVTHNLETGSKLTGPALDYYREVRGVRDTAEMYATQRPRIEYVTKDSAGKVAEPYIVVADRVRMKGNDRIWAGGKVTIDRSDFAARGDSLYLDTGKGSAGTLVRGDPVLRGTKADSFNLRGKRIDFQLDQRALTYLVAKGAAHADSKDWKLIADTIALDVNHDVVERTFAWGDSIRPSATSTTYAMTADSLALDTPGQKLREIRGFGKAWLGGDVDSASKERDWMRGDTIQAAFAQRDSAGTTRTALSRIEARRGAQSYHVDASPQFPGRPSINYARGDVILVTMNSGDRRGVERVDVQGQVDGVHLEAVPVATRTDSAATRTDSAPRALQPARPPGSR